MVRSRRPRYGEERESPCAIEVGESSEERESPSAIEEGGWRAREPQRYRRGGGEERESPSAIEEGVAKSARTSAL